MADTKDSVVLKLVLDTLGAQKEASAVVGTLDGMASKASAVATQMQNTINGRLLGGLANAVSTTIGRVFNDDLPTALAEAELKIKALEAGVGAALGPKAGELAGALARKGFQGDIRSAQGAFQTVQQLQAVFPGTPLSPDDVKVVAQASFAQHQQVQRASATLRESFNKALAGNQIQLDPNAIAQAGIDAVSAVTGTATDLAGAGSALAKKTFGALVGGG